jgi:hypothetical protein
MSSDRGHEHLLAAIVSVLQARERLDSLGETDRRAALVAASALATNRVDLAQVTSYLRTHHGADAVDRLIARLDGPRRSGSR